MGTRDAYNLLGISGGRNVVNTTLLLLRFQLKLKTVFVLLPMMTVSL